MNKSTSLLLTILLSVLLAACTKSPFTQASTSTISENNISSLVPTTTQTALPTSNNTYEQPDPGATAQLAATPSPVLDLTRTKDNPITDAQQIVKILEALESIESSQSIQPGWYLRTEYDSIDSESTERLYYLYHVIDRNLNCSLAMHFVLSSSGNSLGMMTRNYGDPIHSLQNGEMTLMDGATGYTCNLLNTNLTFFINYSDVFSNHALGWTNESGVMQTGEYSYSAWFERENDVPLFFLQEKTDNIQSGYITDPDTSTPVAISSEEKIKTYSVDTGYLLWSQFTYTLANNTSINLTSVVERNYYLEMAELPSAVINYLEEVLQKFDELQLP